MIGQVKSIGISDAQTPGGHEAAGLFDFRMYRTTHKSHQGASVSTPEPVEVPGQIAVKLLNFSSPGEAEAEAPRLALYDLIMRMSLTRYHA